MKNPRSKLLKALAGVERPAESPEIPIPEPYIPHLPDGWHRGVLVVSEAQNLADRHGSYTKWLRGLSSQKRMDRLNLWDRDSRIGVAPWDDGTIQLGLAAALPNEPPDQIAVSNAVLWSRTSKEGQKNSRPNRDLTDLSTGAWERLLPEIRPRLVVTVGKVAQSVMAAAGADQILALPSASPSYLHRHLPDSSERVLLRRSRAVRKAIEAHPEWVEKYRRAKIFFACRAVDAVKELGQGGNVTGAAKERKAKR